MSNREFYLPLVIAGSTVALMIAALIAGVSAHMASKHDEFRARCVQSGGEPLETLTGGGSVAITCRPHGYQGDIVIVEERQAAPIVVRH